MFIFFVQYEAIFIVRARSLSLLRLLALGRARGGWRAEFYCPPLHRGDRAELRADRDRVDRVYSRLLSVSLVYIL